MKDTEKNIVKTLVIHGQSIEKLQKRIEKLEKQAKNFESNLELILKELIRSGCLNIGDRRKPLKRTVATLDALIQVLHKKGQINKKQLIGEIKKLRQQKNADDDNDEE